MRDILVLYEKIYDLTLEQKKVIKEDDYTALLKVLEKKRKLIEEIDQVDIERYIKEQSDPEDYLEKIKATIQKAKELEDKNVKMMQEKYGKMKTKMKDINTKTKSRKGYQVNNMYEAKFIDKKG